MNQIATIHLCNQYVPKIIHMQSKYSERTPCIELSIHCRVVPMKTVFISKKAATVRR